MSRNDIAEAVLASAVSAIEKYGLISDGDSVIVALSGGADSVTLLNILYSLKEKYNITLYAAHLNHGIRGAEADNDEKFCKILCENYNIKLFVKHIDVPKLCAEQKLSEELCGRNERYRFFEEISSPLGAKIATAHTATDNAETLLFNLVRGSSVRGASAIPPVRGNIIRPLIELTRDDIESYCSEKSLAYVTDSTNLSDRYTRNKLRHSAIPVLKELNPRAESAMLAFSRDAAEVDSFLERCAQERLELAKEKYGYNADILLNSDPAVLKASVAKLCRDNDAGAERRHIDLIVSILKYGGAVELKNGRKAVCTQNIFRITADKTENTRFSLTFDKSMSFDYLGKTVSASMDFSLSEPDRPVFRTRESGDRFTFGDREVTKPLRKALNESKIPSELRDSLLVLCKGSTVLWCEGLGVSKQGRELDIKIIFR